LNAADFAKRLDAKQSGASWAAKCPAHEDNRASLSIGEGHDGRALIHCHAGCSNESVVHAMGLELRDLFADSGTSKEPVSTYDYTDEHGALLFQVCRFFPKDFRQRRPDPAGGWLWNLNGTRRVLYRLPELRAAIAAGKRVFVVEGEKDADTVRGAGYTATCNSAGAGKWRPEYTAELKGANVVIVADKDEPGRKHARDVATSLAGIAKAVAIVEAAEGKDVSDHLAAGRKLAELVPVELKEPEKAADGLTHIRDLLAEPDDAVSWIVDGLLPAGGMSVFGGKPKGGKSTTARAIALRVSRGEPVLGRTTTRGPVVYLGLEDPRRVTKGHLQALGAHADDNLYVFTGGRPDAALAWLEGVLAKVDPVLVVVDTLQHLLGVSDLNDYARVVAALAPVLALVRPRQAHMMLVHHAGKGDRTGFDAILGSTAIVGTVDVALLLRRRDDNTRTLATLQRTGQDLPESVLVLDDHQEPRIEGTRADYDARQAETRVADWLAKQSEPVLRADVLAGVDGDANVTTKALYALVKAGKATKTGKGVKGDPFLYACMIHIPHATMQESKTGQEGPNDGTIPACPDSPIPIPACPPEHGAVSGVCPTCEPERFLATLAAEARP
jgi:5S rRNA maturation endonuclease (ribonuclease M5)